MFNLNRSPHLSLVFSLFLILAATATPPTIHVFGDSHAFTFRNIPSCKIHYLKDFTMHRVGRDGLDAINCQKFEISTQDIAIFVFGEIDVRCHIGKQRDLKHRNLEEILETLATNYLKTILKNKELIQGLRCIVCSITPPSNLGGDNPAFPRYGTLADRISITQQLNHKLFEKCQQAQISFLDIYHYYASAAGCIKPELSDGSVHIKESQNQGLRILLGKLVQVYGLHALSQSISQISSAEKN